LLVSKLDEKKEFIGLLKSYLNVIVAFILALGAGVSKLYLSHEINLLFWIGVFFIVGAVIAFVLVAKRTHIEIKKLRDIKD